MNTLRVCPRIVILLAVVCCARSVTAADEAVWTFTEGSKPAVFKVRIEHEEKGGNPLEVSLWMKWRAALESVRPDGEGLWALKIESVKVTIRNGDSSASFDSSKKDAPPEGPPLKPFADLLGAEVKARVSTAGAIQALEGALTGPPSPGGLEIGKDPGTALAKGLAAETVVRLFRLPRKSKAKKAAPRLYTFGVSGTMPGISAFVLSLGEEVKNLKAEDTTVKKLPCTTLKATTLLHSYEAEISMGGPSLKLQNRPVGKGSVTGTYALESGHVMELREKREYALPLPSGVVKFARTLYIEFLRVSNLGVENESGESDAVRKAIDLIEREASTIWRFAHPTVLKYDELKYDGAVTTDKSIVVRFIYVWGDKGREQETTLGFRFNLEGTFSGIDVEDIVQPLADSSSVAPFQAAGIAAKILRAELKRRIKKLDLPVKDELMGLANRKLTAKGVAGLWLKYRERYPKD